MTDIVDFGEPKNAYELPVKPIEKIADAIIATAYTVKNWEDIENPEEALDGVIEDMFALKMNEAADKPQ